MKKFILTLMLAVSAFAMLADAQARPMGGGRSIGRQSPTVARQQAAPAAAPRPAAAPAPMAPPAAIPPKPASPWKGIVGGALLGLGAGALLSHLGMGGAMGAMGGALGSILMIGLLVMAGLFIYRMFRSKTAGHHNTLTPMPFSGGFQGNNNSYPHAGGTPEIGARLEPQTFAPPAGSMLDKSVASAPWGVPADFDTASFLRVAKSNFIRLQAAWDKADVADIREFTTPEVFAELKMQITERGATPDFTDVVTIDAQLLGIETSASDYLASVKFAGMIKSAPNAAPEPFSEVWNMVKPLTGNGGWLLAGIQQLA